MRRCKPMWVVLLLMLGMGAAHAEESCPPLLQFKRATLTGQQQIDLCEAYRGKVLLVVNVASKCGFTYQYEGLEKLHREYGKRGLVVLGFPSNDFANQEPGNAEEIASFCRRTYGVEFPMFAKTHVAYGTEDPLYRALASEAGEFPAWNFHKYLLDRQGNLVGSYGSRVEPGSRQLIEKLETLL